MHSSNRKLWRIWNHNTTVDVRCEPGAEPGPLEENTPGVTSDSALIRSGPLTGGKLGDYLTFAIRERNVGERRKQKRDKIQAHTVLTNVRLQLMYSEAIWQIGADKHCGSNMNKRECTPAVELAFLVVNTPLKKPLVLMKISSDMTQANMLMNKVMF